ncbi:hypothetical protein D3C83_269630 [compost metagenome]
MLKLSVAQKIEALAKLPDLVDRPRSKGSVWVGYVILGIAAAALGAAYAMTGFG